VCERMRGAAAPSDKNINDVIKLINNYCVCRCFLKIQNGGFVRVAACVTHL